MRSLLPLTLVLLLSACGGSSSSPPSAPAQPAPAQPAPAQPAPDTAPGLEKVAGRAPAAPAGSLAYLLAPDPAARDLQSLAATVRDVGELDATGRFVLQGRPGPAGLELVIAAPGHALLRRPVKQGTLEALELRPEAVVRLELEDAAGRPVEDAFALVLDEAGRPLPVPAVELVADQRAVIQARSLPPGRYELLVASGDSRRFAAAQVSLSEGGRLTRSLTLQEDEALLIRWLGLVGGPELRALIAEVAR